MKKLLALAVAVAGLLAGFAWVTSAGAAPPGPRYVSVSAVADPSGIQGPLRVSVLAPCPGNTKVVGGGWDAEFLPDQNGSINPSTLGIEDNYPDSIANGWRVVYDTSLVSNASVVRVTSWAVCD